MKRILQLGNPILEKKSEIVKDPKDKEIQSIICNLLTICKKKDDNAGGLAAPQIGINLQIDVIRRVDLENEKGKRKTLSKNDLWEVMINPEIISIGKKKSTFWEGCWSVDRGNLFGPVTRFSFVKIKYLDRYGNKKSLTATDFFSHVIQHEIDHLNGILFIRYIKNPKNLWKSKMLDKYISKYGKTPDIID